MEPSYWCDRPYDQYWCDKHHVFEDVLVWSGEVLFVTHIGQATVAGICCSQIKLTDVLVVLDLKKDLLSISQLTTDLPLTIKLVDFGFMD